MIDRQHRDIVFECDTCDATLETNEREWVDAKAVFDHEGWQAKNIAGDWSHFCPNCK